MVVSTIAAFISMPKDQRRGPLIIATSCLILATSTIAACLAFRTNYLLLYNPTGMPYAQNVAPTFDGRRAIPVFGAVILAIALILGDLLMVRPYRVLLGRYMELMTVSSSYGAVS